MHKNRLQLIFTQISIFCDITQKSHVGTTLQKIEDPDEIEVISIDRRTLPKGQDTEDGFETRQVFDIDISRVVTEYQAQRLINEKGHCFIALFLTMLPRQYSMVTG